MLQFVFVPIFFSINRYLFSNQEKGFFSLFFEGAIIICYFFWIKWHTHSLLALKTLPICCCSPKIYMYLFFLWIRSFLSFRDNSSSTFDITGLHGYVINPSKEHQNGGHKQTWLKKTNIYTLKRDGNPVPKNSSNDIFAINSFGTQLVLIDLTFLKVKKIWKQV